LSLNVGVDGSGGSSGTQDVSAGRDELCARRLLTRGHRCGVFAPGQGPPPLRSAQDTIARNKALISMVPKTENVSQMANGMTIRPP
jgi:hypothetical protein